MTREDMMLKNDLLYIINAFSWLGYKLVYVLTYKYSKLLL